MMDFARNFFQRKPGFMLPCIISSGIVVSILIIAMILVPFENVFSELNNIDPDMREGVMITQFIIFAISTGEHHA